MTRSNSSDNGPRFLSDLIREFHHLQQQQEATEHALARLTDEHKFTTRRLDAIEATLKAIGCRETDLAVKAADAEGRRLGQRNLAYVVAIVVVPLVVGFFTWLIPATLQAIKHSQLEEDFWRHQRDIYRPDMGPPPIKRPQEK